MCAILDSDNVGDFPTSTDMFDPALATDVGGDDEWVASEVMRGVEAARVHSRRTVDLQMEIQFG